MRMMRILLSFQLNFVEILLKLVIEFLLPIERFLMILAKIHSASLYRQRLQSILINWKGQLGSGCDFTLFQKWNSTWICPDLKYCPPSFLAWHSYSPSSLRWTEWIINSETLQLWKQRKKIISNISLFFMAILILKPFKLDNCQG